MMARVILSTLLATIGIIHVHGFSTKTVQDFPAANGGVPANPSQFPYQVIFSYNQWRWAIGVFCGGSLIEVNGTQAILTAAHCMTKKELEYQVIAGTHHLEASGGLLVQMRTIKSFFVQPNYNSHLATSQALALVFLQEPFELTRSVQPIALPNNKQAIPTGSLTVSGWGTLAGYHGFVESSNKFLLHHVSIPVADKATCKQVWKEYGYQEEGIDDKGHFCLGDANGGTKSCYADRGSPAVSADGHLFGVATWGFACNTFPDLPDIYTSVPESIDWINKVVADYKMNQQVAA